MRHPVWILNSALLLLLVACLFFILFSRPALPEWESLEPATLGRPTQKRAAEINISKIYENDLFDTYEKEFVQPKEDDYTIPFPQPPAPRAVQVPKEPVPQFLDPLKVVLKGIIVVHNDDAKNRIIISDIRTKKEEVLKIGDSFEDAQLIKIFSKKAIFLRSNGQQEVLYLRAKDAQLDPSYVTLENWKDIVRQINDTTYLVQPTIFAERVKTLAQFIELFDLTTVYEDGKKVGSRVGRIAADSLAEELGFMKNDIITSINGIETTDTADRTKIYEEIIEMQTKDRIIVELLRNDRPVRLTFILEDFKPEKVKSAAGTAQEKVTIPPRGATQEQLDMLQERHKLAPTMRDIREREQEKMLRRGRRRNNLTSNFAE